MSIFEEYGAFKQFMSNGLWYFLTGPFPTERVLDQFLLLHVPCFIETPVVNENSADLNQMQYLIWVYTVNVPFSFMGH